MSHLTDCWKGVCGRIWLTGMVCSVVAVVVAGCTLFVIPTNPEEFSHYNTQMFQLCAQILGLIGIVLGFIGQWVKSNRDKQELREQTKDDAEKLALKTEVAKQEVVQKIEERSVRAPSRATDDPDRVLKVAVVPAMELDPPEK